MTKEELLVENRKRLEGWSEYLIEKHAVPIIMIGVVIDKQEGKLAVLSPKDGPSNKAMAAMLRSIANKLESAP